MLSPSGTPSQTTDYVSGFRYEDQLLREAQHGEGRVFHTGDAFRYDYVLRDHLGNTRVLFSDTDGDGCPEALQVNDYYPFGLGHATGTAAPGADYQYLYNGKELQEELGLGWYDYGARFYQPETGRWNGVDALGEKTGNISVYVYVLNNPISQIDPDGNSSASTYVLNAWLSTPEGGRMTFTTNSSKDGKSGDTQTEFEPRTVYVGFDEKNTHGYEGKIHSMAAFKIGQDEKDKIKHYLNTIVNDINGLGLKIVLIPEASVAHYFANRFALRSMKSYLILYTGMELASTGATDVSLNEIRILASFSSGIGDYNKYQPSTQSDLKMQFLALIGAHELGHALIHEAYFAEGTARHNNPYRNHVDNLQRYNLMMDHIPSSFAFVETNRKREDYTLPKWSIKDVRVQAATLLPDHQQRILKYLNR